MDNNSIHTTVPQLRFPDFANDGEWEKDAFENTFLFLPNNTLSRAELNYENGSTKNVHYGDVLIKFGDCLNVQTNVLPFISDEAIADKLQRSRLQDGDVVIADTAEDKTVGKCTEIFNMFGENVVSGLHTIPVRPKKQFAIPYLGFYFNSDSYRKQLLPLMQGVKVMSISKTAISKTIVAYPNLLSEQCKIGSCLSSMDAYISATKAMLELLKIYKKGLMQKLFPAKDQKLPELRFKEFEKNGEWEETKVSEIFHITRGYVLPTSETKNVPDGEYKYPVYSSQTTNNGLMGFYNRALFKDAITWTTDGANAGTVRFRKGEFYCTNVCGVLISDEGYANPCIAEIIGAVSKKYVSLVGNPKLMNNVMAEIPICVPFLPEQRKIADCLTSIDEMINQYSNKIALLELYKKGLMQQLFPTSK